MVAYTFTNKKIFNSFFMKKNKYNIVVIRKEPYPNPVITMCFILNVLYIIGN